MNIITTSSIRFTSLAAALALLAILQPGEARGAAFGNGSFEDNLNGWTQDQNSGGDGVIVHGATEGGVCFAFNTQFAIGTGILSQTFDTVLGQAYVVFFDFGAFGLNTGYTQTFTTRVRDGASALSGTDLIDPSSGVFLAGTNAGATLSQAGATITAMDTIGTGDTTNFGPVPTNPQFSTAAFTFTALSATTTLLFSDQTGSNGDFTDTNIDNVRVETVPEPQALLLLVAGALGLAGNRRNRGPSRLA